MLTEGWDANTVTHVLGVRAFGTQLLCEQVIGRALRRQSYELNNDGLFNVEYADVLGIPFDFNAEPVVAPPQQPRKTIQVKALRERDALEIRFPRVQGYRVELPEERLRAEFTDDSRMELSPVLVGAAETRNSGIIGEQVDLNLVHTGDVRPSTVVYELTTHLLMTRFRDADGEPQLHLFGELKRIARQWLENYLDCKGGTYPAQLKYKILADDACERINTAITRAHQNQRPIQAVLDPYNSVGSTRHVNFSTSKTDLWETSGLTNDGPRCHINWVILDSDWESEFCRVAELHPRVRAYVKNHSLGLEVPYRKDGQPHLYRPDFIVCVDDGHDDLLNLVVEIKGYRGEDAKIKKETMETYWIPGVNRLGTYGRWAFDEFTDVWQMQDDFAEKVKAEFDKMIGQATDELAISAGTIAN
jgi:type III restriction enzyme